MTHRESATAKEVVNSTASKIHSHPAVSQVEPGIEPATMSATAKEVDNSTNSKIHSHPAVSQVEPGIEPATMIENR